MKSMSKSKLKTHLLRVFRELEESGEELVVTDHNRPVLRIIPYRQRKRVEEAFADIRGEMKFNEDPNEPTLEEWEDF